MFSSAREGLSVRYPTDWRAATRNDTPVDNPALCFTLRGPTTELRVVEYLPPFLTDGNLHAARPRHFRFGMLQPSDNSWTRGKTLDFRERGRVFYVGVENSSNKRTVEAVLDSIRVGRGRCRPTSGVGS